MLGMESRTLTIGRLTVGDHVVSLNVPDIGWVQLNSQIISVQPGMDAWVPDLNYFLFENGDGYDLTGNEDCIAILDNRERR